MLQSRRTLVPVAGRTALFCEVLGAALEIDGPVVRFGASAMPASDRRGKLGAEFADRFRCFIHGNAFPAPASEFSFCTAMRKKRRYSAAANSPRVQPAANVPTTCSHARATSSRSAGAHLQPTLTLN